MGIRRSGSTDATRSILAGARFAPDDTSRRPRTDRSAKRVTTGRSRRIGAIYRSPLAYTRYRRVVVDPILLAILFFIAAVLYTTVGHAGASAYLAIMGVLGVAPDVARPTALALNIMVASLVTFRFWRAGHLSVRALAPFVIGSIPLAFIGGTLPIAPALYKRLVGLVLLGAAVAVAATARKAAQTDADHAEPRVPLVPAIGVGAGIGLLSGLSGTGGGIFLSPVLLLAGWTHMRAASAISAAFILANSVSGLAGNVTRLASIPADIPLWAGAVVLGAVVGSEIGSRRGRTLVLRRALSLVLVIAGFKLLAFG